MIVDLHVSSSANDHRIRTYRPQALAHRGRTALLTPQLPLLLVSHNKLSGILPPSIFAVRVRDKPNSSSYYSIITTKYNQKSSGYFVATVL